MGNFTRRVTEGSEVSISSNLPETQKLNNFYTIFIHELRVPPSALWAQSVRPRQHRIDCDYEHSATFLSCGSGTDRQIKQEKIDEGDKVAGTGDQHTGSLKQHMGKRKKTHLVEDQFGEGGLSQDKDFGYHGGNRKGPGGGGSAGGGTRGQQLSVTKHLPKFLQAHAHLLGSREQAEGHEQQASEDERKLVDEEREDDNQEEALLQAVEQNPELLHQFPELKELHAKKEAMELKLKGNEAFKEKKYEEAVDLFSRCIQLDPRCACNCNCDFF